MMSNYYQIQGVNSFQYRVHKFTGNLTPETTYTISIDKSGKTSCNCPSGSYRGYCKHTNMVKKYRDLEKESDMIPMLTCYDE